MKKTLTAALGGLLIATGVAVPGVAVAATAPSEVRVVPAPAYPTYPTETLAHAGDTGFLHRRASDTPWLWTTYADRRTTVVGALAAVATSAITSGGGDTVVLGVSVPGHPVTTTTRPALDLATMTWREITMGAAESYNRLLGDSVLTISRDTPAVVQLSRGSTEVPVTGIPDGATNLAIAAADATGAVLRYAVSGTARYGLLDVASGRVAELPNVPAAQDVVLTADRIGMFTNFGARSLPRAEVLAGTATVPRAVTFPSTVSLGLIGLAGEDIIVTPSITLTDKAVLRYRVGSSQPTTLVPRADTFPAQAPDGVLFVGGSGVGDWSVRKATATSESVVLPLVGDMVNAGVTLSSGVLRHVAALPRAGEAADYRLFAEQIGVGAPGTGSQVNDIALVDPLPCETGATCVRMVDGSNSQGASYVASGPRNRLMRSSTPGDTAWDLQTTDASLVDASPGFRLVNTPTSQWAYQADGDWRSFPGTPAASLWFDTLWRAQPDGVLAPWDLRISNPDNKLISTGAPCQAAEVQATGKHLYWSCGQQGPAGVYDLAAKKSIPVPAGHQFLLGDNYLVRHDAGGALLRYDLTGGTLGEPVAMATFPRGELADDRHISWTVDRFGGDVAWVDPGNAVHIVDPGVDPSDPVGPSSTDTGRLTMPGTFTASAQLSRPITSSTLTVTSVRTGKVSARTTGGPARVTAALSWDGMVDGKRATQGLYRWAISGTVDGRTSEVADGIFSVFCGGTPPLHSYECTGQPSLLTLTSASTGRGSWWFFEQGSPTNPLLLDGGPESLGALNGLVPFGDINQDHRNDLLVRRSDGSLRAYLGGDQAPFGSNSSVLIPGNWNVYDALVHTGDLNGDGRSDLVARDRDSGALFLFTGNGTGGFNASVKIEGGYKGYSRFVGNGDINGDGKADLMMQYDPTSTMYALYGNGDGTFQAGLKVVGTGWLGYNVVIGAGDINEDGRNDLVLRDTAGNLFRRFGTGNGTFGDRTQIGTGYQQYSGIY
ncbi:VCBS repeat-containing protein [Actinoplanes sp. LDG1-06]|uniref:VCBS repeat-containing protein n=1 Tax=Paractinoplanes ovalisporus TaxID=2810368 RepID=A0ABS2AF91_9ACTN|nr:VCBS repeat-containing protein [Actinoplanes ovalisporus]MBM2617916.1 VCBS repeat-containing protein [Actinoplanes ovalisporus]